MDNIIMIGMPGSGKSTVGVLLAKALGMDFIDTDLIICRNSNMKLQEIIETQGLEAFSKLESDVGKSLRTHHSVVATGGSMVLYEEAMKSLKELGTVVYIDVDYSELKRRIRNIKTRGITFAEGETLKDLYEHRTPLYEKYADITVKSGKGRIEDTVSKVMEKLENM